MELALAAAAFVLLLWSIKRGRAATGASIVSRNESPTTFWSMIGLGAAFVIVMLALFIVSIA